MAETAPAAASQDTRGERPHARTAAFGAAAAHLAMLAQAAVASELPVPIVPVDPSTYVPSPMEPSWQVGRRAAASEL